MATSTVYSTKGTYTFTLPANIDTATPMTVDLQGAGGGQGDKSSGGTRSPGGTGGHVAGTLDISAMTPGSSVITVVVGGGGGIAPNTYTGNETSIPGGYNGGGSCLTDYGNNGGGGGGATDIRVGGTGLANRKAVAGGGGGGGASSYGASWGGNGGAGGAATGAAGAAGLTSGGGGGGTAAAGGAGGTAGGGSVAGSAGASGVGGNGAKATGGLNGYATSGGGGGGGYYGGGGGGGAYSGTNGTTVSGGGGGGGSNYAGGLATTTTNAQGGGSTTGADGVATLTYNLVPNQPTLTTHANGDDTAGVTVGWTFSDPDPGDTQSKANVRWRVGTGAWTTINAAVTGAGSSYQFAANTFQTAGAIGQSVEWQVQTYDAAGALGPWSASGYFVPRREPTTTPTIAAPAPFNSSTPQVTVSNTTPFRYARVLVQDAVTLAVTDYGWSDLGSEVTSGTITLPYYAYVNGRNYTFTAYTSDYQDVPVPSPVSAGATAASTVGSPLQPTLTATADPTTASVTLAITNPGSDPNPPTKNEVYRTDLDHGGTETRIASNVAVNGTFTDWQAPTNTRVQYRVAAVTAAGIRTYST